MKGRILYHRIKRRRKEIDFTQKMLSDESGVNLSIIKSIETGRSETSYENINLIAGALNVDVDEIFIPEFRDTKVITVANNKGGSGKTSVVSSLGFSLSEIDNQRILLIDSDMQMNMTYSYGLERNKEKNLNIAINKEDDLSNYIVNTDHQNIDMIVSDFDMAAIEMNLFTKTLRETIIKKMLQPVIDQGIYDFILIDTNPTLGILNFNLLNASDYVIVPVEMSAFGILGLEILMRFIDQASEINPKLQLAGVLRTKVDKRESITSEAQKVLVDVFGNNIFESYISIDANVKKSQWNREPLNIYNDASRANVQYRALAKEVMKVVK